MATDKGCFVAPSVSSLRKIMKPVISTDIMGNRNVEVRPVGARAEPALFFTHAMNSEFCDAVRAAEVEEEKIKAVQDRKAARLKQFQEDVRRRVRKINTNRRKQQLQNDCQAMENHLIQVRSSLRASDCLTERKDCVVPLQQPLPSQPRPHHHHQHHHQHHSPSPVIDRMWDDLGEEYGWKKAFQKHNEQVHAFTNEARRKLSHKKVESQVEDTDCLPGGKWFDSYDKPRKTQEVPSDDDDEDKEQNNNKSADDDEDDDDDIKEVLRNNDWNSSNVMNRLGQGRPGLNCVPPGPLRAHTDRYTRSAECDKKADERSDEHSSGKEEDEEEEDKEKDDKEDPGKLQRVQFSPRTVEARRPQTSKKKGSSRQRPKSAPDLHVGATEFEERRRLEQQKLTYRRLYSQLERQAVRDTQRRSQQRSQIQKIKREKEEHRRQEEERARRLVEPRDPITGETSIESDLRQHLQRSHLQEVMQERDGQLQKQREMTRYLDALRSNLREKLSKQGQELPALCCCGDTLFDTHPDTCANNCFYYKNHRAYARALQSLLTSSEIM